MLKSTYQDCNGENKNEKKESFCKITWPVQNSYDTPAPSDVLYALGILVDESDVPGVKKKCDKCGQGSEENPRTWKTRFDIETMPRVLIIRLARWGNDDNEATLQCVRADETIEHRDYHYKVFGIAIHFGDSPNAGHYVAVVKHGDKWWLYDDTECKEATDEQVSTTQQDYQGDRIMKSYVLFYEMLGTD